MVKSIEFHGHSLKTIRNFPSVVKREVGHQLDRVQRGMNPVDWKPMPSIGKGVKEIRVQWRGQYRIIIATNHKFSILVLHAFQKKSRKTPSIEIDRTRIALKRANRR